MQLGYQVGQRRGGVFRPAVEQDNGAGLGLFGHVFHNLPGGNGFPVQRIRIPLNGGHAHPLNYRYGCVAVGAGRRTHKFRDTACDLLNGAAALGNFLHKLFFLQGGKVGMGIRVIADFMPCLGDCLNGIWVFFRPLAHQEKGGGDFILF